MANSEPRRISNDTDKLRDLTYVPDEDLTAAEWVRKYGSIAGFPMDCRSTGKRHPLVAHDCRMWTSVTTRALDLKPDEGIPLMLKPGTLRVAPDVIHMLLCDQEPRCTFGETTLSQLGFKLICTPDLLSGAIVRVPSEPSDGRPKN